MKKILLLLISVLTLNTAVSQVRYIEGKDYEVLKNQVPLIEEGKKEVAEYFSYTCPHCYNLYPDVKKWEENKKPKDVSFYHLPATLGSWTFGAQAKLTAEKLKIEEGSFNEEYFKAYHVDRNRGVLASKSRLFEFLEDKFSISEEDSEKAWSSFEVKKDLKVLKERVATAGIDSVPVFIVNGKYLVSVSSAKTKERLFDIIDFLLLQPI